MSRRVNIPIINMNILKRYCLTSTISECILGAIMTDCFHGGSVVPSLSSRDKYDAIKELIQKAPVFAHVEDKRQVENAVIQREKILSTGLGRGVAVAHGTTAVVNNIVIALGISNDGINFGSVDKTPVHLLFIIANPPQCQVDYLITLAAVTSIVRNESFRNFLCATTPTVEIEEKMHRAFHACLSKYNRSRAAV